MFIESDVKWTSINFLIRRAQYIALLVACKWC